MARAQSAGRRHRALHSVRGRAGRGRARQRGAPRLARRAFCGGDSSAPGRLRTPAGRAEAAARHPGRGGARSPRSPSARSDSTITTTSHPADVQQDVFAAQVALAVAIGRAGRDSHARGDRRHDGRPAERRGRPRRAASCTVSAGRWRRRRRALDLGFFISLSGIVTFPKAGALRDIARIGPGRPAADRDRCAVSGAGAAPWEAQRTRMGRRRRSRRCRGPADDAGRTWRSGVRHNFCGADRGCAGRPRERDRPVRVDTPARPMV